MTKDQQKKARNKEAKAKCLAKKKATTESEMAEETMEEVVSNVGRGISVRNRNNY